MHANALLETGCELLRDVLLNADDRHVPPRDAAAIARLDAQIQIGVRLYRTIRAGQAVLLAGYEPEAAPHTRVLLELLVHRKAIQEDPTDREARAWLSGERRAGISVRVKDATSPGLYRDLSRHCHGDPSPSAGMLEASGGTALWIGPATTTETSQLLLVYARVARDHAALIAELDGAPLEHLGGFDQELARANAALTA